MQNSVGIKRPLWTVKEIAQVLGLRHFHGYGYADVYENGYEHSHDHESRHKHENSHEHENTHDHESRHKHAYGYGDIHGICIHSQDTQPGDLFVALQGPNHDAHKFVQDALNRGAVAALVADVPQGLEGDPRLLQVPHTLQALRLLAHKARERVQGTVVALTGSFGKTTTKEMIKHVLQEQALTVASVKSFNNHWGVPLTLARLPRETVYAVLEVGMNHKGEIADLVSLIHPHVAMITAIGLAHIGNFTSEDAIVEAKCEIFQSLCFEKGGVAVLNRDSAHFEAQEKACMAQGIQTLITFGKHPQATLRWEDTPVTLPQNLCSNPPLSTSLNASLNLSLKSSLNSHLNSQGVHGQTVFFTLEGKSYGFFLKALGSHWVMDALGALAVVYALGADVAQASQAMASFKLLQGRGQVLCLELPQGGSIWVVDECYNASPPTLQIALETLGTCRSFKGVKRRIAVLGEMYELGATGPELYSRCAQTIASLPIDRVYTSGPSIFPLFQALPHHQKGMHEDSVLSLAESICEDIQDGDMILLKGSRGTGSEPRMKGLLNRLLQRYRSVKDTP